MFHPRYIKNSFFFSLLICTVYIIIYILYTSNICNNFNGVKLLSKIGESLHGSDNKHILGLIFQHRSRKKAGPRLSSVKNNVTGHRCTFTYNQSLLRKSDVVFFSAKFIGPKMPNSRPAGQRWVYFSHESLHYFPFTPKFRFVFNHTMTYHSHSDIPAPIGRTVKKDKPSHSNVTRLMKKKTKLAAWMSSNCHTQSKRENMVSELNRYIKVDTYGSCGELECSKGNPWCVDTMSDYKFFLAFENSVCNGYISEKPWVALTFERDMVPVVYGAGSEAYEQALPPHSYIDVNRFDSVSQLAKYLQFLDREYELYMEYFDWKMNYDILYNIDESARVCDYLHDTRYSGEHIIDLDAFYSDNRSTCHDPLVIHTNM